MLLRTKDFFNLIRVHYMLPPESRPADLAGRLTVMADPANKAFNITDLTRRCLARFIRKRRAV